MIIYFNSIKNKENEWLPQENIHLSQQDLEKIIVDEKLKENMICKQGVGFNSQTQSFTNLKIDCKDYNDDYIFLVKSSNVIKDKEYFWAFVTEKTFDTAQKVVLSLTIDVVSSNIEGFNNNDFKGQAYIERTNNYQRSVNNIHPDICGGVENRNTTINEIVLPVNKKVDTFVSSSLINESKNFTIDGSSTGQGLDIEQLGEIIVTENDELAGFNSFYKKVTDLNKLKIPIPHPSLEGLVEAITTNKKYSDTNWNFYDWNNLNIFKQQISNAGIATNGDNLQRDINNIQNLKGIKAWFSLPAIFKYDDPSVESSINSFSLKFKLENIDLKNHLLFHKEYYLTLGTLFKIPLNFIKLEKEAEQFVIHGKRIVSMNKVVFSFYYNLNDVESFYDLNVELNNGLYQDEYYAYMRDKYNLYESGAQNSFWTNVAQTAVGVGVGFAVSNPVGWASLAITAIGWGFNEYRRYKNEYYKQQELKNKPRQIINVLSFEVFDKFLFNNLKFAQHYRVTIRETPSNRTYYYLNTIKDFKRTEINNFNLLVEEPIIDDVDKINVDQQEYGNIVNQLILNVDNVLTMPENADHLYWQGKIQPTKNPINNFMLDMLNQKLAQGIKILKK